MESLGRKIASATALLLLMVIAELLILDSLLENPTETTHRPFFWLIGIITVIAVMPATTLRKKHAWLPVIMVFSMILTDQTTWGSIWEMIVEDKLADEAFFRKPSNIKTVNVKPDKWSEWVTVWAGKKLAWEIPGKEVVIQFTNGRTIIMSANNAFDGFGEHYSKFRLRFRLNGTSGKVKITTFLVEQAENCFFGYNHTGQGLITIRVEPDSWSDWVELDPKLFQVSSEIILTTPGAITLEFYGGEIIHKPKNTPWEFINFHGRKFRVKGDPGTFTMSAN